VSGLTELGRRAAKAVRHGDGGRPYEKIRGLSDPWPSVLRMVPSGFASGVQLSPAGSR